MKTKNKINIILLSLLLIANSCTQSNFDDVPENLFNGKELDATFTIQQLTEKYVDISKPFSVVKMTSEDSIIIKGIVTSTDDGGNVYKYIILQEEGDGGRAMRISVDAAGISSVYPLGQRLAFYANGLYIGNYGQSPQIGIYNKRPSDNREQPGMIDLTIAKKYHIFPYGRPEPEAVKADTMTIADILAADRTKINYRLVCIKNAWFTGKGANFNEPSEITNPEDKIFAPSTGGVGYPQSREIQDGTGSLFVSTSEFAKFAKKPIPDASYVGDITAIVSWYNSDGSTPGLPKIYHQLALRTLNDLGKGFEGYLEENN